MFEIILFSSFPKINIYLSRISLYLKNTPNQSRSSSLMTSQQKGFHFVTKLGALLRGQITGFAQFTAIQNTVENVALFRGRGRGRVSC